MTEFYKVTNCVDVASSTAPAWNYSQGNRLLPLFNASGVLPPFIGEDPGQASQLSSPYDATMHEFVQAFGKTQRRRQVLAKLLDYRAALRGIGIVTGFQIFNGSFTEDCERLRNRPPSDIDVVTFSHLPVPPHEVAAFLQQNIGLFRQADVKQAFSCDSFFVDLTKDARYVVAETMYWYGLFSHQRDTFMWKGLVKVPLLGDDAEAAELLQELEDGDA